MPKIYTIESTQTVPVSIEEAWDFFSTPSNLLKLTVPKLGMRFTNDCAEKKIYPGMLITYKVKPLLGIPVNWMTEITHVTKPYSFIDEQRVGPFKIWHHQHEFFESKNGTEMKDTVHYVLPFGFLGELGHNLAVKKQLVSIFNYRKQQTERIFGSRNKK